MVTSLNTPIPLEEEPVYTAADRRRMCRIVFTFILFSLAYSWFSDTLVHQLRGPVLRYPYVDLSYWVFHLAGIPGFISGDPVIAWLFDGALIGCCMLVLVFPDRRIFAGLFFGLYFIYFILFNSYGLLHTSSKIGILLMPLPFLARGTRAFGLLWQGMRYFACFAYADAFLWKLFRGTWLYAQQGVEIIKENLTPYLYFHPHTLQTGIYTWCLQHAGFTNGLFVAGFLAEGVFLVGFFTRRFDRYLFLLSILLPVGFLFLSDAFFFELIILGLTLLDLRDKKRVGSS
jgi:hypothetical protein